MGLPLVWMGVVASSVSFDLAARLGLTLEDMTRRFRFRESFTVPVAVYAAWTAVTVGVVWTVFGYDFGAVVHAPHGPWLRDALLVTLGGMALWVLLGTFIPVRGSETEREAGARRGRRSTVESLVLFGAGVAVVPFGEELLYRAYAYETLARWRPSLADLGAGALFAVNHIPLGLHRVCFAFGISFPLTWLFVRYGGVHAPALAHALVNGIGMFVVPRLAMADAKE